MKTDTLFYRLLHSHPEWVFELAGWPPPSVPYRLRAEEIKQTAFRLDGLLMPPEDGPEWPLVFVEVQWQADDRFYARWLAEIFLYLYRQAPDRDWRGVVIYPGRGVERPAGKGYAPWLNALPLQRVYLEEVRGEGLGGWLARLVMARPAEVLELARGLWPRLPAELPARERSHWADLMETILVYKLPGLSREEIRKMLELGEVELKQTRFYQEVFAEGQAEGRVEGRVEGRAEGQRREALALVTRLLRRRLGTLPAAAAARVQELSVERLEDLSEALLDFQGPADLEAWLNANAR